MNKIYYVTLSAFLLLYIKEKFKALGICFKTILKIAIVVHAIDVYFFDQVLKVSLLETAFAFVNIKLYVFI